MATRTIARTAFSCLIVWHSCQCQAFVASKAIIHNRWGLQASDKANNNNCVTTADVLSLDSIRSTLIRQEETIIFAMIERSQFRLNPSIYVKGAFGDLGVPLGSTPPATQEQPLSFLEYMLVGTVRTIHSSTVDTYACPSFFFRIATPLSQTITMFHNGCRKPCTAECADTRRQKNTHFSQTDCPGACY